MMNADNKIYFPPALKPGDRIAIVSPASEVKEEYVTGAIARMAEKGYEAVPAPHVLGPAHGSYSAAKEGRVRDLINALEDPEIKAILCARGGYGCVHLLPELPANIIADNPKWIIGFSDVSALLADWYVNGIASIHGPMAKHLATESADDLCTAALFNVLERRGEFDYLLPSSSRNIAGKTKGVLRGGNFAVLNGLGATPFDILKIREGEKVILFLEDISEPIYAVERMLFRLSLSGTLSKLKGLIFGQFTEYRPDKNHHNMEDMILSFLDPYLPDKNIPIVFDFPVGHISQNYPLTVGASVELEVTKEEVSLHTLAQEKC